MNPRGKSRQKAYGQLVARLNFVVPLLVLWSACLIAARPALSSEGAWAFIWVDSGRNDYEVWKGSATVTIKDGRVDAKMRSQQGVEYKFTGTLSKGRVSGRFTIIGSEFGDVPFSGTYVDRHWPSDPVDDSIGRESIVVTNGLSVLALTREILK
jgi:hypothetical protein